MRVDYDQETYMNKQEKEIIAKGVIWSVLAVFVCLVYASVVSLVLSVTGSPAFATIFAIIAGIGMLLWFFSFYSKNS